MVKLNLSSQKNFKLLKNYILKLKIFWTLKKILYNFEIIFKEKKLPNLKKNLKIILTKNDNEL